MGKHSKPKNDNNSLTMKGHRGTYYPRTIVATFDYQPHSFVLPSMRHFKKSTLNLPTFNLDKLHYTPAFTLPADPVDL